RVRAVPQPHSFPTRRSSDLVPHLGQGRKQFGLKETDPVKFQTAKTVLEVKDLIVEYDVWGKAPFRAVDDVSFDVKEREIVGLVGDRKSTRLNSSHVSISYAV